MPSTWTSRTRPADVTSKAHLERLRLLRRQLGSLLDQELAPGQISEASAETPGAWVPAVDVVETEEAYEIAAELPGVLREDIELRVVDGNLQLRGVRRVPAGWGAFHRMEGRYGPFQRALPLGSDVDEDGIAARLANGVLSVRVAKRGARAAKPREISVNWDGDNG